MKRARRRASVGCAGLQYLLAVERKDQLLTRIFSSEEILMGDPIGRRLRYSEVVVLCSGLLH
jgi:hypothetical protein